MKNTLENKAKFFAQYWGQLKVVYRKGFILRDNNSPQFVDEFDMLELTPLSQISDEDAIELAQIISGDRFIEPYNKGMNGFWNYVEDKKSNLELRFQLEETGLIPANTFGLKRVLENSVYVERADIGRGVDYLRSKSYALPWNGITVEEMIEWGWVKLKNSKNAK